MKIEMAYRNGRVDVFDTMSFTAPSPLGKENALTNFELRFDELGKKGLWLAAHHYDVDPSGTEECPDDETPVATSSSHSGSRRSSTKTHGTEASIGMGRKLYSAL